jgi:L-alanine-DL-glutamate epimerase-like enolase superfamily enzyme
MKITRTEAIGLRIPFAQRVRENMLANYRRENSDRADYPAWIVKIHTDAGLVGLGEASQDPRPFLAGLNGRSVWELLHDGSRGGAVMIAIYDLAAQAAGVPVARLFSSEPRRTIQQIWWSHSLRPALMQAEARRGLELGYTAHKIKARPYEDPVAQVAAIVDVVPQDYQILLDANGSFATPGKTLAVAEALRRFHQVKGFEQPIAHEDLVGYRQIRRDLPMRLAVHWEGVDARTFVLDSLCDAFVVEDFLWGPALMNKSAICELSGQKLWVENGLNTGISQVFQAHQAAALPNVEFTISLTHVAEDDIVIEPFVVKQGLYTVPQKPGLGVTLDENAMEKYRI